MAWKGWENATVPGETQPAKKASKYRNVKVEFEGNVFDSKREANRWIMLRGAAMRGEITDLRRQTPFDLTTILRGNPERGFQSVGKYIADFTYYEKGQYIVEDAKGAKTDIYKWKKRHFEIEYGFKIRET
jgi:hypothetical protein